ncbi:MAG: carboxymuconolactone decarboxylase family protein [Chryseolinea sp.]
MEKRIDMAQTQPAAYKAMYGLTDYLRSTKITGNIRQLVKMRASQINGCALCLEMHAEESQKIGIPLEKLILLDAWRESSYFNDEERAALALTEEVTLINQKGLSDEAYKQAVADFGEEYVAALIMEVVTINAWNRISIATRSEFRKHH